MRSYFGGGHETLLPHWGIAVGLTNDDFSIFECRFVYLFISSLGEFSFFEKIGKNWEEAFQKVTVIFCHRLGL